MLTLSAKRPNRLYCTDIVLEALINSDGSAYADVDCDARFVYWRTGQTEPNSTPLENVEENQTYRVELPGLDPDTTYFFFPQIINSKGTASGSTLNFKTLVDPNAPPIPFGDEENTAIFQYFISGQPAGFKQGTWTYSEFDDPNVTADFNQEDVLALPQEGDSSRIISLKTDSTGDPENPGFIELSTHANPIVNDLNNPDALNELTITGGIEDPNSGLYHATLKVRC